VSTQEIDELKDMFGKLDQKLEIIRRSLKKCQQRCHVDNPPGRWRGLGRALLAMFKPTHEMTMEEADAEA